MGRSTPEFQWFPGTLFLSSRWEVGGPAKGCWRRRRADSPSCASLGLEAGLGVAVRAAARPTHVTDLGFGAAGHPAEAAAEAATAAGR